MPKAPRDDTLRLAVVYSPDEDAQDFRTGIQIAVDQVNAAGGLLGRPLAVDLFREDSYTDKVELEKLVAQTLQLATRIGKMPSVLAVIGHGSSATAVPASVVYERHRKLFLATHATATSLSNHRLDLTFALQPNNADNANFLARWALSQGLRKVVVLSDNSGYGIETVDQFRSLFAQGGGTILHRGRLTTASRSIDDLLLFLMDNDLFKPADVDAFFVTSSATAESAQFIARARQMGLTMPIIGPEYLYSRQVEEWVGAQAMRDVVAVSIFDGDTTTPEGQALATPFAKVLGRPPGLMAAMGYDAVKVLAHAVKRAGTLSPEAIADNLRISRYEAPFVGASGPVTFDSHGLITDTTAHVVRHDGTRFHTVARYRKPLAPLAGEGAETPMTRSSPP
ncbi:MAG: ABC transporter substrate-binding protein [Magnetospirillum sp.]|nr:ABC transporter substrate-binding protein [Magnetospirillum sp.]